MFNEQLLVQAAESATGNPLLEKLEARRQNPGEIISQRGLLGATRDALVFVADELLRAGTVTVWKRRDLSRHTLTQDLLSVTLTIHQGDTAIQFRDLPRDRVRALLGACGLTAAESADADPPAPKHAESPSLFAAPSALIGIPSSPATDIILSSLGMAPSVSAAKDSAADLAKPGATQSGPRHDSATKHEDADTEDEDEDENEDEDEDEDDSDSDSDSNSDSNSNVEQNDSSAATSTSDEKDKKQNRPSIDEPELVSPWLGVFALLLMIAAIAIPTMINGELRTAILDIRPSAVLAALRGNGGLLILSFYAAAIVTVVGAPGVTSGHRPTVFWTTLPMFFGILTIVHGIQEAYPNPKQLVESTSTLQEQLQRIRRVYDVIPLVAMIAAYTYGLPLVGLWLRALLTHLGHRKGFRQTLPIREGDSQPPLLMIGAALIIPFVSCLYVQRSSHALWAILIALVFVTPSALLCFHASRLSPKASWSIGGSPTAFIVQGLFVYVLYWLLQHHKVVTVELDALLLGSPRSLLQSTTQDSLQRLLTELDFPLLRGLLLSQLGIVIAAIVGQRILVRVDANQKVSGLGWTLTVIMLCVLAIVAYDAAGAIPERVSALLHPSRGG